MKPGVSSLNPYAVSYIPLSKREVDSRSSVTEKDSNNHNSTVCFLTPQHITEDQHLLDSSTYPAKKLSASEAFLVESQPASSSFSSSSQNGTELKDNQLLDEEFDVDMDIEYLRMAFPNISDQSLADVYTVNRGDLDAAIDMLSQLEFVGVESSGSLPETLDIGDVSESGLLAESASLKAAEASTSSSRMASANVS